MKWRIESIRPSPQWYILVEGIAEEQDIRYMQDVPTTIPHHLRLAIWSILQTTHDAVRIEPYRPFSLEECEARGRCWHVTPGDSAQ